MKFNLIGKSRPDDHVTVDSYHVTVKQAKVSQVPPGGLYSENHQSHVTFLLKSLKRAANDAGSFYS